MKITDVKVQSIRVPVPQMWVVHFGKTMDVTLVTVNTDQGIKGYSMGRAVGGAPGIILGQEIVSVAKNLVCGENPFDREKIWQKDVDPDYPGAPFHFRSQLPGCSTLGYRWKGFQCPRLSADRCDAGIEFKPTPVQGSTISLKNMSMKSSFAEKRDTGLISFILSAFPKRI